MKATTLMAVGLTAWMVTSCSNNELVEIQEQRAITYNILSQNAVKNNDAITKGTAITSGNLTTKAGDFMVYGFLADSPNTQYVGSEGNGVKITWQTDKWDHDNAADLVNWPGGKNLNFYAVNPSEYQVKPIPSVTEGLLEKNFTAASQTLKYSVPLTDNALQKDLMYAMKLGQASGQVTLNFKHALAQVVFKGKVVSTDFNVKVKEINICQLQKEAVFTFPATESATGTWGSFADKYGNYPAKLAHDSDGEVKLTDATVKDLSAADGAMLLIPQTSTAWTTTPTTAVPISQANTNHHTYLLIKCDVFYKGHKLQVSTGERIYVPFKADWEPGKKYTYTLNFGGGYKIDGTPVVTPITYTATVAEWTDAAGAEIVL